MKFLNIRVLIFISLATIMFSCSGSSLPIKKPVGSSKRIALLVGVEDYAGNNNDLIGIDKDISKMKALCSSWGFSVTVLKNSLNLKSYLSNYSRTLDSNDIFIIYYSGHGTSIIDRNGDESDGRDEALVLSDSRTNQYLIDDTLNLYLNRIGARKLIIIDSCHSGTIYKSFRLSNIEPIDTSIKSIHLSTNNFANIKIESVEVKKKNIFKKMWEISKKKLKEAQYNKMKKDSMVKFINPLYLNKDYSRSDDEYRPTATAPKLGGEFIFFGATQDNEKSIATRSGSIFTKAFISNIETTKSINSIYRDIANDISGFQPSLRASSSSLRNVSMNSYLKMK